MLDANNNNQHPDTEQLILQAAEDEFLNKGFNGARTTAIAEKAGVTHAMLHYYFRTKERLFDKVLEAKTSEMRGVMFGFIDNKTVPLSERIEKSMRRHFEYLLRNPRLPLFIINELSRNDNKVLKHLQINKEATDRILMSLQDAIDTAAKNGECRKANAQSLLLDIIALNVFSFIGAPLLNCVFPDIANRGETFLCDRLEENIRTILNKLRP